LSSKFSLSLSSLFLCAAQRNSTRRRIVITYASRSFWYIKTTTLNSLVCLVWFFFFFSHHRSITHANRGRETKYKLSFFFLFPPSSKSSKPKKEKLKLASSFFLVVSEALFFFSPSHFRFKFLLNNPKKRVWKNFQEIFFSCLFQFLVRDFLLFLLSSTRDVMRKRNVIFYIFFFGWLLLLS
jgi:hypothetical protein